MAGVRNSAARSRRRSARLGGGCGARHAAVVVALLGWVGCARNPGNVNENLGQSVVELGDAISALREENAVIQEQLDSLRRQVARQDTVMRQLANLAGVPVPPP